MFRGFSVSSFKLLVIFCAVSSLLARTVSESKEGFSLRVYVDEQIRNRFSDCGQLIEIDIRSQQGDIIFDCNYDKGFQIVLRVNLATSHIDLVRYYLNGKVRSGGEETLCLIPHTITNPILDFSQVDITRFLIGNAQIDTNAQFVRFYEGYGLYAARYYSPADNNDVEFRLTREEGKLRILQRKIFKEVPSFTEDDTFQLLPQPDEDSISCYRYLSSIFNSNFYHCQVLQVRKSTHHHAKYQFTVGLDISHKRLDFVILVQKRASNEFMLIGQGYLDEGKVPKQFQLMGTENTQLTQRIKQFLQIEASYYIEVSQPYFRITYLLSDFSLVKTIILYDFLTDKIETISTDEASPSELLKETSHHFRSISAQDKMLIDYAELALSSLKSENVPFQVNNIEYRVVRGVLELRFTFIGEEGTFTKIYSYNFHEEETQQQNQEQSLIFKLEEVDEQPSASEVELRDISSVSDAKFIPFMTATTLSQDKVNTIKYILTNTYGITPYYKIILANQIRYAVRVVIECQDGSLFEAVIDTMDMIPLQWKQLYSINFITNNIFQQYYDISSSASLHQLLKQVLPAHSSIKKIINVKKRVALDGIYYQIIIRTTTYQPYKILLYSIPQINYHEVLLYAGMESLYDKSEQVRTFALDKRVLHFIESKYGSVLRDSTIRYLATMKRGNTYYRIVYESVTGMYEVIVSEGQVLTVVKWEKLHNGYTQHHNESVETVSNEAMKAKLSTEPVIKSVEMKKIPNFGQFYKIMYTKPFPLVLFAFSNGEVRIVGVEEIALVPTSVYYNEDDFYGFRELNGQGFRYDPHYSSISGVLASRIENGQIEAIFTKDNYDAMIYKIICRVERKLWLAVIEWNYVNGKEYLLEFQEFSNDNKVRTYDWKCKVKNLNKGYCQECESGWVRVLGRCYQEIDGCSVQFDRCYVCKEGYSEVSGLCLKHPTPQEEQDCSRIYDPAFDMNCLQYVGRECLKCAYRYYMYHGACIEVPDECAAYNEHTGECLRCYLGYKIEDGVCVEANLFFSEKRKSYKNYYNFLKLTNARKQ